VILTLASNLLRVEIDPNFGGEITSIVAIEPDLELLLQTPWGRSARSQRHPGLTFPASASEAAWMARYGGGWQMLFPHAGPPETVGGSERTYHGEASVVRWGLTEQTPTHLVLETRMFTVPAVVTRQISLIGAELTVTDRIHNVSQQPFAFSYVHHPVFGAPFLEEGCIIETGAQTYVPDPRAFLGEFTPGQPLEWPVGRAVGGAEIALDRVPNSRAQIARFGSLRNFVDSWAAVRNPRHNIGVRLSWDAYDFPEAWLWLEAGANLGQPWFGQGHALGIEPSTTSAPPSERQQLVLAGEQDREFSLRFKLLSGAHPITSPNGGGESA
jgi:hypothetical protein